MEPLTAEKREPLSDQHTMIMLAILIRKESAFLVAKDQLTPDQFNLGQPWLSLIWACVLDHYEDFEELPDRELLIHEINRRLDEGEEELSEDEIVELDELVDTAFYMKEANLSERVATTYLKTFLADRLVEEARELLISDYTPIDVQGLFRDISAKADDIASVDPGVIARPFDEGWDKAEKNLERIPTMIPYIDQFLEGGMGRDEAITLMGPIGGGKTTTGVMLSTLAAKQCKMEWDEAGQKGPLPVIYHFTYEEPKEALRLRALCCAARIPKGVLTKVLESGDKSLLSSDTKLKKYEQIRFRDQIDNGIPVQGERSRYDEVSANLNLNWRVIDMSGVDPQYPNRGTGLVVEIAAIIKQDQVQAARKGEELSVGLVVVDYVGAAVERHMDHRNINPDQMRHYIAKWVRHMKVKICRTFNCPSWSLHQLSTQANAYPPTMLPKRTDSKEGKSFNESADFGFAYGNTDKDSCMLFGAVKQRRTNPKPSIVVQIVGRFATIRTRTDLTCEPGTRVFIEKDVQRNVDGQSKRDSFQATRRRIVKLQEQRSNMGPNYNNRKSE